MKLSNIVIAAIFLVLISLFSLNFEKLTGYVPKQESIPIVSVLPESVKAGEQVEIRIKVNKFCIDPKIEVVSKNGLHKDDIKYMPNEDECATQDFHTCKSNKYCQGNIKEDVLKIKYKTEANSKGDYKIRVRYIERPGQDRFDEPFVEAGFTVV